MMMLGLRSSAKPPSEMPKGDNPPSQLSMAVSSPRATSASSRSSGTVVRSTFWMPSWVGSASNAGRMALPASQFR